VPETVTVTVFLSIPLSAGAQSVYRMPGMLTLSTLPEHCVMPDSQRDARIREQRRP
jgi:hypothetical protein